MASNQNVINIMNIPKSTVYDWDNRENKDWRNDILKIFKSMSIQEIKNLRLQQMTKEDLKNLDKNEILDFIKAKLSFSEVSPHLRYVDGDLFKKEHWRFNMSGYEDKIGNSTVLNMEILNKFAYLGIYDYTTYLFLDFYKGTPTLYYQYWGSSSNEEEDFGGYGTVDIIYEVFKRTILTEKKTRRRN